MTNEEKAKLLRDYKDNNLKDAGKCVETLIEMGDLKGNYWEILKLQENESQNPFDDAVEKYAESDNYDELAALLTFLTREDTVDFGVFKKRADKGEVGKIVDRMIKILNGGTSGLARERMMKNN